MTHRFVDSLLIVGLAAVCVVGWSQQVEARRFDVGFGGGALFTVEEGLPLEDNYYAGLFSAVRLGDNLDLELGVARSEGRDTMDGSFRSIYHVTSGLRLYPKTKPDRTVRFYLSAGGSLFFDLKRDDDATFGLYLGPGLRMKAGEHSGLDFRAPLVFSAEGDTNSVLLPTLSWFYEF